MARVASSVLVSLSKLVSSKSNPRRVKPERDAHRRLVASIRAHGLIEPLVIRPEGGKGQFEVIAGKRRLRALREVHGKSDAKVPCMLRAADPAAAKAVALAENFAREPMHPADEAQAFSDLASDGKSPEAIAAEFGVPERYVLQRMKLSSLAPVVKAAYRKGENA